MGWVTAVRLHWDATVGGAVKPEQLAESILQSGGKLQPADDTDDLTAVWTSVSSNETTQLRLVAIVSQSV